MAEGLDPGMRNGDAYIAAAGEILGQLGSHDDAPDILWLPGGDESFIFGLGEDSDQENISTFVDPVNGENVTDGPYDEWGEGQI